jgi:hypothetical protein
LVEFLVPAVVQWVEISIQISIRYGLFTQDQGIHTCTKRVVTGFPHI